MKNIALLSKDDKTVLFTQTAAKMEMHPSIVEKDFWVCFLLDHLFHDCKYKDMFVFKGGTSLSKSYHVIERFSEDIDLILDWRKIINDESNPWDERSKTKQDTYNKQINKAAAEFYRDELVPVLNKELTLKLGDGEWVSVDSYDEMVVNFMYPRDFELEYIVPVVRLEIGPLAEWLPSQLLSGREIEFAYNGKQYSITNSKGRWMLYCDTDKLLLKDICDFEEREILVNNVGAYEISGRQIADIFNEEADSISNLVVL